jgi:hypothetical protein
MYVTTSYDLLPCKAHGHNPDSSSCCMKKDSSQNLRSAMEDKAKKAGGGSPRKGKRQMRPGQAKTLSDLPQLSA